MYRLLHSRRTLVLVALLALATRSAHATNKHTQYALSFSDLSFADASATYTVDYEATYPAGVRFRVGFHVYGDLNSIAWTGSGNAPGGTGLTVSNITINGSMSTVSAIISSDGNPGTSDLGYLSRPGDGVLARDIATPSAMTQLHYDSSLIDATELTNPLVFDLTLPGDWSHFGTGAHEIEAGSFSINPDFLITQNFVYDPDYGKTFFSAELNPALTQSSYGDTPSVQFTLNGVPEPGNMTMLAGIALSVCLLARRRKAKSTPLCL